MWGEAAVGLALMPSAVAETSAEEWGGGLGGRAGVPGPGESVCFFFPPAAACWCRMLCSRQALPEAALTWVEGSGDTVTGGSLQKQLRLKSEVGQVPAAARDLGPTHRWLEEMRPKTAWPCLRCRARCLCCWLPRGFLVLHSELLRGCLVS